MSQTANAATPTVFDLSEKAENKAFTGKLYPPKVLFFGMVYIIRGENRGRESRSLN